MTGEKTYVWICRWEEFQHYPPDRNRGPAWIKDYTSQLDDERYLCLTDRQRALLRDLRDIFATMRGRLSDDCAMIARRRNAQTRRSDLEALNHAGLIEFLSREALDQALDKFYTSRARPRTRREVEEETEREDQSDLSQSQELPRSKPTGKNGHINGIADEPAFALLHFAVGATTDNLTKLRRAARGLPLAAIVHAREAAQGPGVRDPLAVALAELKKSRDPAGLATDQ